MVHCRSLKTGEETETSFASIIKNIYLVPVWRYDSLFALVCCLGVYSITVNSQKFPCHVTLDQTRALSLSVRLTVWQLT
jgi:hypothetical protein